METAGNLIKNAYKTSKEKPVPGTGFQNLSSVHVLGIILPYLELLGDDL